MKLLTTVILAAAVGGCGLGLPASRPPSGEGDVVTTEVSLDVFLPDRGSALDVTGEADGGPIFVVPDVALDAANDTRSPPEVGMDASEVSVDADADVFDASVVTDVVDVTDATNALDAPEVRDATDAADVTDRPDDTADAVNAAPDVVDATMSGCADGRTSCGGVCVDTATDERHCGRCGRGCPAGDTCIAGGCGLASCTPGTADCDGRRATGCEVNLATNEDHCGRCESRCATTNGTSQCRSGACVITSCVAPRADCDRRYDTGCETDTTAAAAHCGACGNACLSNVCRNGTCWNVAGSYETQDVALCGSMCTSNSYTGACSCPSGYRASTLRRLVSCALLSSPMNAVASICGSLTPGTFGGVFQNDPMCDLACITPNTYTGTCSCPAGTTALMNFELLADTTCGRARNVRTYLCGRTPGAANLGGGFGGAYLIADPSSGGTLCRQGNPFVSGAPCACPTGFGPALYRVLIPQAAVSPGFVSGHLVLCVQ